jgi:hypothetical protein
LKKRRVPKPTAAAALPRKEWRDETGFHNCHVCCIEEIGLMSVMQNFIRAWRGSIWATIFFGLVGISLLRKLFDQDVWFHMVVGREVIRRMGIPPYEFYILPRLGEPGEFHEWGFGVLYYLIEHYFGYFGMAIVNSAIGCGILLCLYFSVHDKSRIELWPSLPVIALALWVIEPRLNFRPETLLYLLLAAEIFLLENYLVYKRIVWLIPLPFFTWLLDLGHPSAIFLIAVFGLYSLQAVFSTEERIKTAGILGAVALAMAGTAALNPYGLHQLLMPFYALSNDQIADINEFLPVLQTEYAFRFIVMATIGAMAIIFAPPARRLVDVLLFLLFAMLAFRYARNIALLGIVAYLPAHKAFTTLIAKIATTQTRKKVIASLSVFFGIAGVIATAFNADWGVGIYEQNTPYKSARLLKQLDSRGNILNFYPLGNYLAWELDRPVFVDGRNYNRNRAVELHNEIFRAEAGWQDIVNGFNIQSIVTPATLDFSGEIIPLVGTLVNDPDWVLVEQERAGLLFLKSPVQGGIRTLPKNVIWHQAIEELNATMALYPNSLETYRSLATAFGHLGDTAKQQYYSRKFLSLSN